MVTARSARSPLPESSRPESQWTAEWALFQLQIPGQELRPAGILLLDSRTDQLYLSLRDLFPDEEDEDLNEIWAELANDLRSKALKMGASQVLEWLEADASHTFQLSARRQITGVSGDPNKTLEELFRQYVLADQKTSENWKRFSEKTFSSDQIRKAQEQVGPLPSATIQILTLLEDPNMHFRQLEKIVSRDPVLAAHLLRVANLASFNDPARTLFSAVQRLGVDGVKFQVLALTIRKVFSAPAIRKVWDHSVTTAQLARQLAQRTTIPPSEAGLLGLLHDVGQVVLFGLGSTFSFRLEELRDQGFTAVKAERALCGASHAELGGSLLASWSLPADMVEAVAAHHDPARSDAPLSALLYLTEAYGENDEDTYSVEEHAIAAQRLHLSPSSFSQRKSGLDPDLAVLRFAA